jgi:hypothetical protein
MLGAEGEHPANRRRSLSANAKREGNPEAKRLRLHDIPPVQKGVVSTSKIPTVDAGRLVDIEVERVKDISLFFDGVGALSEIPDYDVAPIVKSALASTWANKEFLRNAVYTDLSENHGISFPKSSTKDSLIGKILRRFSLKKSKTYREVDLASLMAEYGKRHGHEANNMCRIMRELPVTTTSKPDLAPLDSRESKIQIRFGEFANNAKHNQSTA